MREIKFRAWDKAEKRWYDYEDSEIFIDLHGQPLIYAAENPYPFANTDIELMQYTGLKDKNGKEIYEGDIVRYRFENAEVVYSDGAFALRFPKMEYVQHGLIHSPFVALEVIGNIYDNPELLEKEA